MKQLVLVIAMALLLSTAAMALDVEAVICSGVEERMPVGEADQFSPDIEKVYLWTKVTADEFPTTIRHVWLHEGQEIADVELQVNGSPWRTYSYKTMIPEWTGTWEVKVVGADGNVILAKKFMIGDAKMEKKPEEPKSLIQASPKVEAQRAADSTMKAADTTGGKK